MRTSKRPLLLSLMRFKMTQIRNRKNFFEAEKNPEEKEHERKSLHIKKIP